MPLARVRSNVGGHAIVRRQLPWHIGKACCKNQGVRPKLLTIHADRGAPMTAKSTALLYTDLGIAKICHSRPYTSNDNPYSEANFRTMKYHPEMPARLGSLEHARQGVRTFVAWYNDEYYHVGLALLHPADVHYNRTANIVAARQRLLDAAHTAHPERFVSGRPIQKTPPPAAWINPPAPEAVALLGLPITPQSVGTT